MEYSEVMVERTKVRRALDRLAYASLILDVCIAIVTALSILGEDGPHQQFLVPINYLLTIVVALSIVLFVVLLVLKSKERLV